MGNRKWVFSNKINEPNHMKNILFNPLYITIALVITFAIAFIIQAIWHFDTMSNPAAWLFLALLGWAVFLGFRGIFRKN
jgi:hypothetical protein